MKIEDVEIGDELPAEQPDVRVERVREFAKTAGMLTGRCVDHEKAREQGRPGAILPGIMSQALLAAVIHRWAPGCAIQQIDTVFRAPILVDSRPTTRGVVTSTDTDAKTVDVDLTIENEAGETRVLGTAVVRLD